MKALLSTRIGPPEELEYADAPDPVAGEGEVVIAVKAAGVNFPDALIIEDKEITEGDQEASVIKFVNQIIWEAFKDRATDIHFEPAEDESAPTQTLEEVERDYILRTLESTGWRVEGKHGAAKVLGLNPSTLRTRMLKLGIQRRRVSYG